MDLTHTQKKVLKRTDADMEETYIDFENTKEMDYGNLESSELKKLGVQVIE